MPSSSIKYTSTKAIDHFNAGATLMKIVGYVHAIDGLKELPKSKSRWLYKCIVNNNDGRRVRLLFWGDDALKFHEEIKMYQILKITGGIIKDVNVTYHSATENVLDKEFQYGRGSTLEVLGHFDPSNGANPPRTAATISYVSIEMEDVCTARGPVQVNGWIKEPFRSIATAYGSSYGSGMICTAVHRMSVHVSTFVPRDDLIEGMKIAVKGTIDRRNDAFVFNIICMDNVEILHGAPDMTEDDMDEAVEAPPLISQRAIEVPMLPHAKKPKLD